MGQGGDIACLAFIARTYPTIPQAFFFLFMSQGFSLSPKVTFVNCVSVYDNTISLCPLLSLLLPSLMEMNLFKILVFDNDVIIVFVGI